MGKTSILKMATLIVIQKISSNWHSIDEYAIISIYLKGMQDGKPVRAGICQKTHLINELKVNLLLRTDILGPKQVLLDLEKRKAFIRSCNITIPIKVKARSSQSMQHPIHIQKTTIILAQSSLAIQVHQLTTLPAN